MELALDLYVTIISRVAVMFACGGYLFYRWAKAPRRYYFDLPFLMGVSFSALAVSKIFDIFLYQTFNSSAPENQYIENFPGLVFATARWLFILVVAVPLLYANLRVWVAEHERARLAVVGAYSAVFVFLILEAQTYNALGSLLPFIVLPAATITIVTFLFAYARKRLPNVHGLFVGLGWAAYLVTNSLRPMLLSLGASTGAYYLASVAEILDMLAWLVIFAGLTLRPKFARAGFVQVPKLMAN